MVRVRGPPRRLGLGRRTEGTGRASTKGGSASVWSMGGAMCGGLGKGAAARSGLGWGGLVHLHAGHGVLAGLGEGASGSITYAEGGGGFEEGSAGGRHGLLQEVVARAREKHTSVMGGVLQGYKWLI